MAEVKALGRRVGRVAARLGRAAGPRLVLVFEQADERGRPPGPGAVETVQDLPSGVRIVHRQPATADEEPAGGVR